MIELAKAFARNPELILMDEPTAVLSVTEASRLFARIRAFKGQGGSVIFTSHRLDEVSEIADRIAVLRDGEIVRIERADSISQKETAEAMVGRSLSEIYPPRWPHRPGPVMVSVSNLSSPGVVENASLEIRVGEILGISGLVGSGRTELFEAALGLRSASCAAFRLHSVKMPLPTAREAWKLKLAYLTEDRKAKGLLLDKRLVDNVALVKGALTGSGFIDFQGERADFEAAAGAYGIRATRLNVTAGQEVLDMQYANWNPDRGFEVMQDMLQRFPTIDGVWAGDDDAALGVLAAINSPAARALPPSAAPA